MREAFHSSAPVFESSGVQRHYLSSFADRTDKRGSVVGQSVTSQCHAQQLECWPERTSRGSTVPLLRFVLEGKRTTFIILASCCCSGNMRLVSCTVQVFQARQSHHARRGHIARRFDLQRFPSG
jgi:hypothetical protein